MDNDSFFDTPDDAPDLIRNGRYNLPDPTTGKPRSWQRASNFAAPLDDTFGLERWRMRQVLQGLNRRPDLLDRIAALVEADGPTLDGIVAAALESSATDAKANRGTAVHDALTLYDVGREVPARFVPHAKHYGAELERQGLAVVAIEMTVMNTSYEAAGRFDRVFQETDGSMVIGDIKTGRLEYPHGFAVQCAIYATASHMLNTNGVVVKPMPWTLRTDYAVLVHVDPDTGATSVYRLDIQQGRRAAVLAEQIRAWRATKGILLPYVPPPPSVLTEGTHPDALDRANGLVTAPVTDPAQPVMHAPKIGEMRIRPDGVEVYWTGGPDWEPLNAAQVANLAVPGAGPRAAIPAETTVHAGHGPVEGLAPAAPDQHVLHVVLAERVKVADIDADPTPDDSAAFGGPVPDAPEPPAIDPETEAVELAKMPKAELQRMLKALGGTDLAHHRAWLAEEIVKRKNAAGGASYATEGTTADGARSVTIDHNPAPGPAQSAGFFGKLAESTPHTLALIGKAETEQDLRRLHAKIVEVGGDQAWTDEMATAAMLRLNELTADAGPDLLARLATATTIQELGLIWSEVTLSGTAADRWTPEIDAAAQQRRAVLEAQNVAPVNPFAQ